MKEKSLIGYAKSLKTHLEGGLNLVEIMKEYYEELDVIYAKHGVNNIDDLKAIKEKDLSERDMAVIQTYLEALKDYTVFLSNLNDLRFMLPARKMIFKY